MGIIRQGVLGGFRNKTGSVVGAYWRNLDVIKGLPRISNKPATQAQIDQRFKFGLVTSFLSNVSDIIDAGYKKGAGASSPMNESVSYHLKNAILGVAPNFSLDYSKLQFTSGVLKLPVTATAEAAAGFKVDFSWPVDGVNTRFKDDTDTASVLVYSPVRNEFVSRMNAVPRSTLAYSLQLPPHFSGLEMHCYISFSSTLIKGRYSKTMYLGEVLVL